MTSVCTGSLVYADAGLLDGRPATTYWGALDRLAELGTDVRVDREARFVDDGDVDHGRRRLGGIDMALHLVAGSTPGSAPGGPTLHPVRPEPPV